MSASSEEYWTMNESLIQLSSMNILFYEKEENDSIFLKSSDKSRASSRGKTRGASVIHNK